MSPTSPATADPTPAVALTIAGSDSGGGAGIQADLATFAALGVHGTSVVTALTAQNTHAVTEVHVPPVAMLEAQLDAVLGDLPVAAVKTGMLATVGIVEAVGHWAAGGRLPNLVVDPVLVTSAGDRLFAAPAGPHSAEDVYLDVLFPHALIVTPNAREAAVLLGRPVDSIRTVEDQRAAAMALARRPPPSPAQAGQAGPAAATGGPAWIVVKGGHLPAAGGGSATDVVYEVATGAIHELTAPWLDTANDHGTGCTFAAATAAGLAGGDEPLTALRRAKAFVHDGLQRSRAWRLGAGHGPVSHLPG